MKTLKVGVVLSGAGYLDGSEIQESVLTLLMLDRLSVDVQCYTLDQLQSDVMNHQSQTEQEGQRHLVAESARISRGRVQTIDMAKADDLDALIIPGGYGVAKNLSDFARKGTELTIHSDLARLITDMHQSEKPLGFICIAPVLAAKLIPHVRVTVGQSGPAADAIKTLGAQHVSCNETEVVVDDTHLVVSTPAYMIEGARISDVSIGIQTLTTEVLKRVKSLVV